jgi:hypothetical protein
VIGAGNVIKFDWFKCDCCGDWWLLPEYTGFREGDEIVEFIGEED